MPTIQDTIYPRFKASISDADLDRVYTPTPQECVLAAQTTKGEAAYLGFLILLKTFQRLGYFVFLADIPDPIITHIAQAVDHRSFIDQLATYDRSGSRKRHQTTIRAYQCVKPFRDGGAAIIQQAVADAAIHTEQLDDLINRAIEELIHQSYELPGFTTLIK